MSNWPKAKPHIQFNPLYGNWVVLYHRRGLPRAVMQTFEDAAKWAKITYEYEHREQRSVGNTRKIGRE
jgi:hypothetical protein